MKSNSELKIPNRLKEFLPLIVALVSLVFSPFFITWQLGFLSVTIDVIVIPLVVLYYGLRLKIDLSVLPYIIPVLFLLGVAVFHYPALKVKTFANMEIRIWVSTALFLALLLMASRYHGKNRFNIILSNLLWLTFLITSIAGLLEYSSGYHIIFDEGRILFTSELDVYADAPTFIWYNPNNFVAYLLILIGGLILFDKNFPDNFWKQYLVLFLLIYFSQISSARYGLLSSFFYSGYLLYLSWRKFKDPLVRNGKRVKFSLFLSSLILLYSGVVFYTNNNLRFNLSAKPIEKVDISLYNDETVKTDSLKSPQKQGEEIIIGSDAVRMNLILNGIEYFKESPLMGIGPGEYQRKTKDGENKYYVKGVWASHHYVIDLISEYGVAGILFLLTIFISFLSSFKNADSLNRIGLITVVLLFLVAGNLPSKFMNMSCSVLMLSFIFLLFHQTIENRNKGLKPK